MNLGAKVFEIISDIGSVQKNLHNKCCIFLM